MFTQGFGVEACKKKKKKRSSNIFNSTYLSSENQSTLAFLKDYVISQNVKKKVSFIIF